MIVENGGHGGSAAGPIARKVMDYYLLGKLPEVEPAKPEEIAKPATKPNEIAGNVLTKPAAIKPAPSNPAVNANAPEEEHYD